MKTSIADSIMVVDLRTKSISQSRQHTELTASLNKASKAKSNSVSVKVDLWPENPVTRTRAITPIKHAIAKAEALVNPKNPNALVVPIPAEVFGCDPFAPPRRGISSMAFEDFSKKFSKIKSEFDGAVASLKKNYDEHLKEAKENARDWVFTDPNTKEERTIRLYKPEWYPAKEEIDDLFALHVSFAPIPDRFKSGIEGIADATLLELNRNHEEALERMHEMIRENMVGRVMKPLAEIAEKLADPEYTAKKSLFHKLNAIKDTIRDLRIPDTDDLVDLVGRIAQDLTVDTAVIREDEVIRRHIAAKTEEHMKRLGSIFNR